MRKVILGAILGALTVILLNRAFPPRPDLVLMVQHEDLQAYIGGPFGVDRNLDYWVGPIGIEHHLASVENALSARTVDGRGYSNGLPD